MRLTNHVYLLSGFAYGLHPNVYGIDTPEGVVIIDTGLNQEDMQCVDKRLQQWGLASKPILAVLITHAHFDHAGNAYAFRERGAVICAGDGDAQGIVAGDDRTIAYSYSMPFPACPVDTILHDGDVLRYGGLTIACIHVPGHSQGSMAYDVQVDGQQVMFTGDFIQAKENGQVPKLGFSGSIDYDPKAYMASLKKIRKWVPDIVLGGHHQPCLEGGWKILDKAFTFALANWREPIIPG